MKFEIEISDAAFNLLKEIEKKKGRSQDLPFFIIPQGYYQTTLPEVTAQPAAPPLRPDTPTAVTTFHCDATRDFVHVPPLIGSEPESVNASADARTNLKTKPSATVPSAAAVELTSGNTAVTPEPDRTTKPTDAVFEPAAKTSCSKPKKPTLPSTNVLTKPSFVTLFLIPIIIYLLPVVAINIIAQNNILVFGKRYR